MSLRDQPQSNHSTYRRILSVVIALVIIGLVVRANYWMQVNLSGSMREKDFMSLWTGAKAIALGLDPYDPAVWRPLRVAYGCNWNPDHISPWPHWTHMFFVPLSFFTPEVAGAIWMTICELSVILGVSLLIRTTDCENRATLLVLSLGCFLFRPVFPAIFYGQTSPVLFLLLVVACAAHFQGHPFIAGLLLAMQALKPNATAFLLLAVGMVFLFRQDWRALAGLLTGGLALLFVSWCILPGWFLSWLLGAITGKSSRAFAVPSLWGLVYDFAGSWHWPYTAIVAVGIVYSGLLVFLWKHRNQGWLFSVGLAVIASTFLSPYLWAYEYVVLLFPTSVALFWGLASKRGPRWIWWAGWWVVNVVLSWVLFLIARQRGTGTWTAVLPLGSLGYFVLARLACDKGTQVEAAEGLV